MTAFILLGLAICAAWIEPVRIGSRSCSPWVVFFIAAVCAGLITGVLEWYALIGLGSLWCVAHLYGNKTSAKWERAALGTLTTLIALALALHKLPGFHNPLLIANVLFTPDAAPFTQYANFDKGAAGLILLVYFCPKSHSVTEWISTLWRALPYALVTSAAVLLLAQAMRVVTFEPKLPAYTLTFLLANLFFTCVAEEAFFRGFLQGKVFAWNKQGKMQTCFAVVTSALLFGLAHAGGGTKWVALAALAGLGYGAAYARTRRIESSILSHFLLNAIHFMLFTYPRLS